MRHEIELFSPSMGRAMIIVLAWGEDIQGAFIEFHKRISRLEALEHGAELMRWFDSMALDAPVEMPFDWCVISSTLE